MDYSLNVVKFSVEKLVAVFQALRHTTAMKIIVGLKSDFKSLEKYSITSAFTTFIDTNQS